MKVTIQDIAQKAKVSRGTVDKVLHNRKGVSEPVRKRVKEIMEELGYNPNKMAKALSSAGKPIILGVIIPAPENAFFASVKWGMEKAQRELQDFGLNIEYYYYSASDGEDTVIKALEEMINKGVQGIAVRGFKEVTIQRYMKVLEELKIPVITYDSDMEDVKRICFVGEDQNKSGRIAASLMAKALNGQGEIVIFSGSEKVMAHTERIKGFKSFIEKNQLPLEIKEIVYTKEQAGISLSETRRVLKDYPGLKGIFNVAGCSDCIAQALKAMKVDKEVKLITYNFSAGLVEYIKEGTIDFALGLRPSRQGWLTISTLFNYVFFNEKPKTEVLNTSITIGIDENIDELVKSDGWEIEK